MRTMKPSRIARYIANRVDTTGYEIEATSRSLVVTHDGQDVYRLDAPNPARYIPFAISAIREHQWAGLDRE